MSTESTEAERQGVTKQSNKVQQQRSSISSDVDSVSSRNNEINPFEGLDIEGSPYKIIGHSYLPGSFGKIYLTKNKLTDELLATKLVRKDNSIVKLKQEYECYRKLGPCKGLPKIHFFGECGSHDAMVMDLLGPNLEEVFDFSNKKLSLPKTTRIAIQILKIIEFIHSQNVVFCNVKPENFCLGRPKSPHANQVYLIGFVDAKFSDIFDQNPNEIFSKTNIANGSFGTPRYMSLRAHKCKKLTRRDDLESIGYMLLYFLLGKLPWQGLKFLSDNKLDIYKQIYNVKKSVSLEDLCTDLPPEYYHYMLYTRTLKFTSEPNYRYLITMFERLLNRLTIEPIYPNCSFLVLNDLKVTNDDEQIDDQQRNDGREVTSGVSMEQKQVSFKKNTETIQIDSELYFPFLRDDVNDEIGPSQNLN